MAVFKRNSNEAAFAGGEKHFVDVIKNRSHSYLKTPKKTSTTEPPWW